MKSTVEQLSPTRVKINVEVPFDELKPNFDKAYKKIAQQVRIPGFRPGKAPPRILEQRLGRGVVLDEVVNEAVPAKYAEALSSGEVQPLSQPEIEVTNIEDGDLLTFTAEVDVRPEITVPEFDELSVSVDDVEVTEDEIAEQLDSLRARFGTLTGVDRAVQQGDFVVIDLAATVEGQDVPEAATSGLSYEVGSGELIEGLDDAVVGATEGDERTFTTTLVAGEYAGREAEVTVTLGSVKVRELPELDDEFAQLASEFDTLEELRGDVTERLRNVKSMQQGMQARDKVLEALLAATEVPLPEKIVESEMETRKHEAVHSFEHDEERLDEYLELQGQTREEFDAELRTSAEDAVKTQLVLDSVADAREVSVNESELTERIMYQAQRYNISPEQFVQQVQQAGQLGAIYADVRRGKALAEVVRQAEVTDASGNRVDIESLFGHDDTTPEEAESEAPREVAAAEADDASTEASTEASSGAEGPVDADSSAATRSAD